MKFDQNDIDTKVSFEIYGASTIGGEYENVTLLSISSAKALAEYSPRDKHNSIYSSLPQPRPQNHTDYMYYVVLLKNGKVTIVGDAWIKPDSIVRGAVNEISIVVSNVNASDMDHLSRLIRSANYTIKSMSIDTV